jgi:hypothetical protein
VHSDCTVTKHRLVINFRQLPQMKRRLVGKSGKGRGGVNGGKADRRRKNKSYGTSSEFLQRTKYIQVQD